MSNNTEDNMTKVDTSREAVEKLLNTTRCICPEPIPLRQQQWCAPCRLAFTVRALLDEREASSPTVKFTDNEYDWLEEFCAQVSSSTNDVEEQTAAIDLRSKIRDRR